MDILPVVCFMVGLLKFCCQKHAHAQSSLKGVLLLTRHGDRAPTKQYPKDPYRNYNWTGGYGALTPIGEKQMRQSGSVKAMRYASLLAAKNGYRRGENVLVLSSSAERCVESAKHFLDGFLNFVWPRSCLHVIPVNVDEFLIVTGKPCLKYESPLTACAMNRIDVQEFLKSIGADEDCLKYIEDNSGLKIYSLAVIYSLDDTLTIQQQNNMHLPSWAETMYEKYIHPIANFAYTQMSGSRYMQVRSGVLLKEMLNRLHMIESKQTKANVVIYSAHDLTISGFIRLLDIKELFDVRPEFGCCLAVELHENPRNISDPIVKLFYFRDHADEMPLELKIPQINGPCTLSKFREIMKPKIVADYDAACRGRKSKSRMW